MSLCNWSHRWMKRSVKEILAAQLDLKDTKSTERERLFLIYGKHNGEKNSWRFEKNIEHAWWRSSAMSVYTDHRRCRESTDVSPWGQKWSESSCFLLHSTTSFRKIMGYRTTLSSTIRQFDRHSFVGTTDRTEMWTHTNTFLTRHCDVSVLIFLPHLSIAICSRIVSNTPFFSVVFCWILLWMPICVSRTTSQSPLISMRERSSLGMGMKGKNQIHAWVWW